MLSYQFKNLADKKMYSYIIFLFSIFSPGFTFLYLTDNNLFHNTDIIKLLILSIIYTIPLLFLCLLDSIYDKNNPDKKLKIEIIVMGTSLKTILFLYAFIFFYNLTILYNSTILSERFSAIELFYGMPALLLVINLIIEFYTRSKDIKRNN